jgi:hypothetical protein
MVTLWTATSAGTPGADRPNASNPQVIKSKTVLTNPLRAKRLPFPEFIAIIITSPQPSQAGDLTISSCFPSGNAASVVRQATPIKSFLKKLTD